MIQILRKAQKQQGDGQTSLDEKERTPLTKEQKEARLKDEAQKKQAQEQKEARLKDETQKKQDLRLKQEQEEQQKKKAQEEEEQKKKRKQTSLRKKEEETHLKDEDTKQKKDKKKAEDVALKRAQLETAKRETEEKKAITADKKQKAAASKEKQERAQIVVQGLRSLSQTGIHNMSAVDREQFFALAMEYKALASTGAIQFEQQEEVESMLQQLTGLASDKSEVNFYLTKAQEERAEKERKNAEKMADFLKSFKKNPYIIYEDVDSFVQAVEEGHISADTIVTNANGEEVTLRTFTREELTDRANKAISAIENYTKTSQEYKKAVVSTAAILFEMNPEDVQTTISILATHNPDYASDVQKLYQRLCAKPQGREIAARFRQDNDLDAISTDEIVADGLSSSHKHTTNKRTVKNEYNKVGDRARVSRAIGDGEYADTTQNRVQKYYTVFYANEGLNVKGPVHTYGQAGSFSFEDGDTSGGAGSFEIGEETDGRTDSVPTTDTIPEISIIPESDNVSPKSAKSLKGTDGVNKVLLFAFETPSETREDMSSAKAVATLSNAANNGPSVVGEFGDKVPMNDYADDFGYNQGGNGHRSC